MPTIRFAQLLAERDEKTASHEYSRPERTAAPATAEQTEAATKSVARNAIDPWCDTYMARLAQSLVMTRSGRKNELRAATSGTDCAVLGALCNIMRYRECACFEAPEQEVAERANVDRNTAANALRRLENEAYVVRHPACGVGIAQKYSLVVEKLAKITEAEQVRDLNQVTEIVAIAEGNLSDEAFCAKNLGKTATQVYTYLLTTPKGVRPADIAHAKKRHASTVKANLIKLADLNMVYEEDGLWFIEARRIRTDADLEKVTRDCSKRRAGRQTARRAERAAQQEQERERQEAEALLYDLVLSAHGEGLTTGDRASGLVSDC